MDTIQLPKSNRILTSSTSTFVEMLRRAVRENRIRQNSHVFSSMKRSKSMKTFTDNSLIG